MKVNLVHRQVSVDEFVFLRDAVGWGYPDDRNAISTGLKNTLFSVCAEAGGELAGYGRIIGDGGINFYIQDIIVCPAYQRQGVGTQIMTVIMNHVSQHYPKGSLIGLMSAKGKEAFYKKFGFIERPNEDFGPGMMVFL